MRPHHVAIAGVVALSFLVPLAATECPQAVIAAVQKAHAGAGIASCTQEQEDGKTQFSVELGATLGKSIELDVSPDGTILLTEQTVELADVPPAVMKALAAKYGQAKPTEAEMQTAADGTITYEIEFLDGTETEEATFGSDGTFIEEE